MLTNRNKDSSIFLTEISNLIILNISIVNILRLHLLEDNIFIPYVPLYIFPNITMKFEYQSNIFQLYRFTYFFRYISISARTLKCMNYFS